MQKPAPLSSLTSVSNIPVTAHFQQNFPSGMDSRGNKITQWVEPSSLFVLTLYMLPFYHLFPGQREGPDARRHRLKSQILRTYTRKGPEEHKSPCWSFAVPEYQWPALGSLSPVGSTQVLSYPLSPGVQQQMPFSRLLFPYLENPSNSSSNGS